MISLSSVLNEPFSLLNPLFSSQFLSSDHINCYDTLESAVEKSVVLSVNGQESRLVFVDHPTGEVEVENLLSTYRPHAVLLVMAVDDYGSFLLGITWM